MTETDPSGSRLKSSAGFALVGHQQGTAVGGEGEHVRLRTYVHGAQEQPVAVIEGHPPRVGLRAGLHRDRDQAVGAYRDRVGHRRHIPNISTDVQCGHKAGCGRVGDVQHVDLGCGGVDHEQVLGNRVVRDDLGGGRVEHAGVVAAQHRQRDTALAAAGGRLAAAAVRYVRGGAPAVLETTTAATIGTKVRLTAVPISGGR